MLVHPSSMSACKIDTPLQVPHAGGLVVSANGTIMQMLQPGTSCAEALQQLAPAQQGALVVDLHGCDSMPVCMLTSSPPGRCSVMIIPQPCCPPPPGPQTG
jgi:hypothetical protein